MKKTFHDIFSSTITLNNIFQAYYEFRKGKRNKKDVLEFELNLEGNLYNLHQDLISGEYKHGPYNIFSISDPKPRKIAKAAVRDRVVHHLVAKKLEEIYEPCFVHDSYSSRKEKGTHRAVERLQKFICRGRKFSAPTIIKCDIKKFFASIDHEILVKILERKIKDVRFINLLKEIIYSFPVGAENFLPLRLERGIPLGNLTSQVFANIYLNELDQFIKHRLKIRNYIRYCDDFIFAANYSNPGKLSQINGILQEKLRLQIHPDKIVIRKPNQGIDFLGYVVFQGYIILRTKTKRRILKQARTESSTAADRSFLPLKVQSYFALLKHCKSYKIRINICKIICKTKTNNKMEPIKPEQLISLKAEKETPLAFNFEDLKIVEDYLSWKKEVPDPIRRIVEGAMKGVEVENKETGLNLVDQFLDDFSKNIQTETKGSDAEAKAESIPDKRVASAMKMIKKVETSEGKLDIFSALSNPASSWGIKKELYKTQIEPLLGWLASESLRDEARKQENKKARKQESNEEENTETDNGSPKEDNSGIPPTGEDAVSSMEHGVEKKEGEPGNSYFSINPFWGGYYKQHTYDQFDLNSGRWNKKEGNEFYESENREIDIISRRVLSGKIRGGENPLAIPLPYNWTVDVDSLEIDAEEGNFGLKQNQDGAWYLAVKKEGIFSYKLKIGQKKVLEEDLFKNEAEISGKLPDELAQKIEEVRGSSLQPMAKARSLVRFVRDHLEYSNDPEAYKKYITYPEKYFEEIWREKKTDCYVSNTLSVRALSEAGFNVRFMGGFYCKEKNKDGSAALGASNGHAWLEVWDSIGHKWIRLDATPKGDPNMNEEQQEQELSDENNEGDYGENDPEIMNEEELKKKIAELKNKQKKEGKKSDKSLADLENQKFAELAGCSEAQAKEFLRAIERVREIKNEQGIPITELLKDEWRKIVQESIVKVSDYKGPVRMEEGDRLEDVVSAKIDISSGEYNPTGFEKEQLIEKIKNDFGGIDIYFSFDLSGSMSETDFMSGRSKADVQLDAALLFIDSIMQCAVVSRRESEGGEEVLPIKIMATLASSVGVVKLPLTDKWGPAEQWAVYSALKQLASGGTPTHQTLGLIEKAYDREMAELKKKGIREDRYPLNYVVEITDGAPNDIDETKKKHQDLINKGLVVRSLTIGGVPIDETGLLDKEGGPLRSFSQIPGILAKDIIEQFKKLKPHRMG